MEDTVDGIGETEYGLLWNGAQNMEWCSICGEKCVRFFALVFQILPRLNRIISIAARGRYGLLREQPGGSREQF